MKESLLLGLLCVGLFSCSNSLISNPEAAAGRFLVETISFFTNDTNDPNKLFDSLPPLAKPKKESWRHFSTGLLVTTQGSPYHMAHDLFLQEGQNGTLTAKFDYGSVFHKDLEDEYVYAYLIGDRMAGWEALGKYKTDSDGKINIPINNRGVGKYIVRCVVAGDLTESYGLVSVVKNGSKAVVFDVDGTLTTSDMEAVTDYLGISTAAEYASAQAVVKYYFDRGYEIIYLTARPYWVCKDSRDWFIKKGFVIANLKLALSNDISLSPSATESYKRDYLLQLKNTVGLAIVRAYGNATTDIQAYAEAGIPLADTFIIGANAGLSGTQALNPDYAAHYQWLLNQ